MFSFTQNVCNRNDALNTHSKGLAPPLNQPPGVNLSDSALAKSVATSTQMQKIKGVGNISVVNRPGCGYRVEWTIPEGSITGTTIFHYHKHFSSN